jgi:hypothetical protein
MLIPTHQTAQHHNTKYTEQYADTHPPDCRSLQHKRPTKPKFYINITCKSEGLTVMVLRIEVFRDMTPYS